MSRTAEYSALILRSRPSGESNRDVWLLCSGAGLLRATVFGGPKSRLRAYAAPFNSGHAWIYHDPVKDSRKLNDFDVRSWRPGLRELYERAMAADAIAETILASHGGGGHWDEALALAEIALDTLENADEALCDRILVRFLWRWSGLLGLQPDLAYCAVCGEPLSGSDESAVTGKFAVNSKFTNGGESAASGGLWYSAKEGGLLCADCASNCANSGAATAGGAVPGLLRLGRHCLQWLCRQAAAPDDKSFREAKALSTLVLAEALGKRLASWEW